MYKYVKEYLEILRKANEAFNNNIKVKLFWNMEAVSPSLKINMEEKQC